MSQRFHLPPEQRRRSAGFPGWTAVLGGFVIGFLLAGLIFGVFLPCWRGECDTNGGGKASAQSQPKELIGSSSATAAEPSDYVPAKAAVDSVAVIVDSSEAEAEKETEPAEEVTETARPEPVSMNRPIRIQVLNGCGVKGIARTVAPALRSMGFDVRESGNAKNFKHEVSRIYARIADWTPAFIVADSVGIDSSNVGELIEGDLTDIDVTIVVGADHKQLRLGLSE